MKKDCCVFKPYILYNGKYMSIKEAKSKITLDITEFINHALLLEKTGLICRNQINKYIENKINKNLYIGYGNLENKMQLNSFYCYHKNISYEDLLSNHKSCEICHSKILEIKNKVHKREINKYKSQKKQRYKQFESHPKGLYKYKQHKKSDFDIKNFVKEWESFLLWENIIAIWGESSELNNEKNTESLYPEIRKIEFFGNQKAIIKGRKANWNKHYRDSWDSNKRSHKPSWKTQKKQKQWMNLAG